jgi:hypothetical protein
VKYLYLGNRNRKHVYIQFLLKMTDTMTSQNTDLSSCDTLYNIVHIIDPLGLHEKYTRSSSWNKPEAGTCVLDNELYLLEIVLR